ncbi:MAG: type III pantothenate kinase [Phycisphaerales bacterium]|nr:type III pantothenate kinase [Phycisphaerales bacterium]
MVQSAQAGSGGAGEDRPGGVAIIAVSVGNSRIKFASFNDLEMLDDGASPNTDIEQAAGLIAGMFARSAGAEIVMASVNPAIADTLESILVGRTGGSIYRLGRDLGFPIKHAIDDDSTLGQDRLLNAIAAFEMTRQACIVIDCGTAMTVDFVDGEGTFQGGAIVPGTRMMLRSLHEQTAALPLLELNMPASERGAFGKDTTHAMMLGVIAAARGAAYHLVNTYAEAYGGYPRVIATGGDARFLFEGDEIVEHVVPDLQLRGIAVCAKAALAEDAGE